MSAAPICSDFEEHPNWREKHPTGPVTWDGWCSLCGFRLEDRPWASGITIEGNNRRLARVRRALSAGDEVFTSSRHFVVCSTCCPSILK